MYAKNSKILLLFILCGVVFQCVGTSQETRVLSRKRRYLAFPEGSSLQMIYDLTYPSVAAMGDLLQFGHTAVMAWKLPHEPIFMDKIKMEELLNETKVVENNVKEKEGHYDYGNQDWQNQWQIPLTYDDTLRDPSNFPDYHNNIWNQKWNRLGRPENPYHPFSFLRKEYFEKSRLHHHIHRRSRRDLFGKIEKMFTAFKKDGKACLLKAICQFNQFPKEKGSLIIEILKSIFKTRPYDNFPGQDRYDLVAYPEADCEKLFPSCKGSILSHIFVNKKRK